MCLGIAVIYEKSYLTAYRVLADQDVDILLGQCMLYLFRFLCQPVSFRLCMDLTFLCSRGLNETQWLHRKMCLLDGI